jgi:flagellar P-ring protein precursor FlgI
VINERTGTVVVGGSVRPGPAAGAEPVGEDFDSPRGVAHRIFEKRRTAVVPQEQVDVNEGRNQLLMLEQGTTLEAVVRGLNPLGAGPRDIMAIMQALTAAGALRAELVIL